MERLRVPCAARLAARLLIATLGACAGDESPNSDQLMNPVQANADSGLATAVPDASVMDAASATSDAASKPSAVDAARPQIMDMGVPVAQDAGGIDGAAPDAASDSGTQADSGALATTDGGFPRNAEVNVTSKGPYTFTSYTTGLTDPAYSSAIMYYPENAPLPLAAIVFAPGFTATKENYTKLGEIFASHGFAMMLTTPTNTDVDQPPARGKDLVAAVARIKTENERAGSPLQGKLAPDRICVTGQSMGGGGTLWAASELGDKIRCAVPLQPWQPSQRFQMITAPTLFIAAELDDIAGVAENARVHYDSIPNTVEKIFAEFKGADHYLTTNRTTMWDDQARVMVSFYKLKLEDDTRYAAYLYGGMEPKAALSRFEYTKKP